jgi:UDP-glucose 4-epimerase
MTDHGAGASGARHAVVTGGAGFIGSHLVDRLVNEGYDVLVVDDLSTGVLENLRAGSRFERLDVATADLGRLFAMWRPEVVYHLAAQASVERSSLDPLRDLAVNVVGTHRVAVAAREAGAARLVFVSSGGAVYGESTRPATERTTPRPTSHYGVHKLAAEGHVRLACLPHAILRPSNVYGPRQRGGVDGAVIAAFVGHALGDGVIRINGDGTQLRDFVHVQDLVEALLLVGRPITVDGTWNVATGSSVSIGELADLLEVAVGRRLARVVAPRRPGDVVASSLSSAELRRLGWRPTVRLADGLASLLRAGATSTGVADQATASGSPSDG